jgi:hypothetical protein
MPNNPVQFVQNGEAFIQAPDPGRMGEQKDFFEDRDAAFAAHQAALSAMLDIIEQSIGRGGYGPATYIRVVLREAALAKSYRPNTALPLLTAFLVLVQELLESCFSSYRSSTSAT